MGRSQSVYTNKIKNEEDEEEEEVVIYTMHEKCCYIVSC